MNKASISNLKEIWSVFRKYKHVFPHLRTDYLKRQIDKGSVIYDNGVIINFDQYKRKVKLGNKQFEKDTIIIHQIANDNLGNGQATSLLKKFLTNVNNKVILTVRKSNQIARRFYEKNNFKEVGIINWANNTIKGVIYEKC